MDIERIEEQDRRQPWRSAFEPLDELDRRILAELTAQPRMRVAELARRVALSAPAVAERQRRLEETGVLAYRTDVNPRALGYGISAIVTM